MDLIEALKSVTSVFFPVVCTACCYCFWSVLYLCACTCARTHAHTHTQM